MRRFLLVVTAFICSIKIFSLEIELEVIKENFFLNNSMYYLNDNVIISSNNNSILKYNINSNKIDEIFNLDDSEYSYTSFGASRSSSSDEDFLLFLWLENKDAYWKSKSTYLKLRNKELIEISKSDYEQDKLLKNFNIGDYANNIPWSADLLGDYLFTIEGIGMEVLPYITKKEDRNLRKYFINKEKGTKDRYFKPIADTLSSVDVSSDKFRIAMLGWTTEKRTTGNVVGDYKGLFIFRIIYDGLVNDDSTIYNINSDGLLVEKELIASEIEVKVKDIKQVGDLKYYHIEYGEDKSGYILEDNIDIK